MTSITQPGRLAEVEKKVQNYGKQLFVHTFINAATYPEQPACTSQKKSIIHLKAVMKFTQEQALHEHYIL
ncbi:MAG: hypothetical protein CSA26_08675 [Desulfobacterales bacterium]|nr:MAG: hypothetical protein CSA26_08675 [Desulfobacterales bacterium]